MKNYPLRQPLEAILNENDQLEVSDKWKKYILPYSDFEVIKPVLYPCFEEEGYFIAIV